MTARALEIEADSGGIRLAGTLWRPELLQVEVFPEGDHRLRHGEPPRFVDGYSTGSRRSCER